MSAKKVVGITVLVFLVIGIVASANSANKTVNESLDPTNKSSDTQQPAAPTPARIGEPVRDGRFEFTVKTIQCGVPTVGDNPYLTKQAQGQFCLITLSVKNIGDQAQALFSANQKLLNAQGQQFATDDLASSYHSPNTQTVFSNINPGNSVEGVLVFDLPKDQSPATAELHDSAFSGGVKVSLQ